MSERRMFPLSAKHSINRRASFARKMWRRRGPTWMNGWFWLEPTAVKPSKRGRRG